MKKLSLMDWILYLAYAVNIAAALCNANFTSLGGWLVATYWYWAYRNLYAGVDDWLKSHEKRFSDL